MSGTPQLPLGFGAPPHHRFASFVAGEDADAFAAITAAARAESTAWLFLAGPEGSGKTHLLVAACHEAASRGAQYLPLGHLGDGATDALIAMVPRSLVAVDDVDAVAGKLHAEVALFDAYNRVRDAGGQMLFAARHRPGLLRLVLPDLVSRLSACTQLKIASLGDEDRRRVFGLRAIERGLEIEPEVVDFLFRRHARDLGALLALLDRIDRESLAEQRRVTVPFLRRIVGLPARES
jgi:DnaA-homolog protein